MEPKTGKQKPVIPKPTKEQVKLYLSTSKNSTKYYEDGKAINKLFNDLINENKKIEDILIKVSLINYVDSTNIYDVNTVANHILKLDIDTKLTSGDLGLVKDIALITMKTGKQINFYSFATKYCAHHSVDIYPIFDSYVSKILCHFNKEYKFANFKEADLKDYRFFNEALNSFTSFFKLNEFSKKDIDHYIWLLGKEYYPNKYIKKPKMITSLVSPLKEELS